MMPKHKLDELLKVAEAKRANGLPNSDEFVTRKLREDRAERADLFSKIKGDADMVDMVFELEAEIVSIDHALTAYPELTTA